MADVIRCGLCSSEFLLSNYQEFLQHKITKCHSFHAKKSINARQYVCYHCDYSVSTADEFIHHFEHIHKLRLLKTPTANATVQMENYETVNLTFPANSSTNQFINFPLTFNKIDGNDNRPNHFDRCSNHLSTPSNTDEFPKEGLAAPVLKHRERCCIDDPNGDCCDELSRCPLLMDNSLIVPSGSGNNISEQIVEAISSQPNRLESGPPNMIYYTEFNNAKYSCSYCKRLFRQKVYLDKHVLVKHDNRRPFKCAVCDYETVEKGYLKTHMRKHTGERPYACSVCDYKSSQNCALKVHMKRIHPHFMHNCNYCTEKFRTPTEHKRHEQICSTKLAGK